MADGRDTMLHGKATGVARARACANGGGRRQPTAQARELTAQISFAKRQNRSPRTSRRAMDADHRPESRGTFRNMDINLVVLSVGNTRIACGTFVGGELLGVSAAPDRLSGRSGKMPLRKARASLGEAGRGGGGGDCQSATMTERRWKHIVDPGNGTSGGLGRKRHRSCRSRSPDRQTCRIPASIAHIEHRGGLTEQNRRRRALW